MTGEDIGLIKGVLLVVGALFPIVNPIGHAPIFLTLTADQDDATRAVLARKVAINGFILLLAAMFVGEYVLDFFGVSIPVAAGRRRPRRREPGLEAARRRRVPSRTRRPRRARRRRESRRARSIR